MKKILVIVVIIFVAAMSIFAQRKKTPKKQTVKKTTVATKQSQKTESDALQFKNFNGDGFSVLMPTPAMAEQTLTNVSTDTGVYQLKTESALVQKNGKVDYYAMMVTLNPFAKFFRPGVQTKEANEVVFLFVQNQFERGFCEPFTLQQKRCNLAFVNRTDSNGIATYSYHFIVNRKKIGDLKVYFTAQRTYVAENIVAKGNFVQSNSDKFINSLQIKIK